MQSSSYYLLHLIKGFIKINKKQLKNQLGPSEQKPMQTSKPDILVCCYYCTIWNLYCKTHYL